jgi:hypothetical protein
MNFIPNESSSKMGFIDTINSKGCVNFVISNLRSFEKFHALKNVKKLTFSI